MFLNYLIALEKYQPRYFLYENNKSMAPAIREQITAELGMEPILINSALVSAQNRQRLYWTNIPGVGQPEDKGILLRDILESGMVWMEKGYCLKAQYSRGVQDDDTFKRHQNNLVAEPVNMTADGKARCLRATYYKDGIRNLVGNTVDCKTCVAEPVWTPIEYNPLQSCDVVVTDQNIRCTYKDGSGTAQGYTVYFDDVKGPSVIAGHAHKMKIIEPATGKEWPVYEVRDGQITIKGTQYPIKLADGFYFAGAQMWR